MRICKTFGCLSVFLLVLATARAEDLSVPYGSTQTVGDGASHVYGTVSVAGTLKVNNASSVALDTLAVTGGVVRIEQAGTSFGQQNSDKEHPTTAHLAPDVGGVYGRIEVAEADLASKSSFQARYLYVDPENGAVSHASGYVDVASVEGGALNVRQFANDSSLTGRLSFARRDGSIYTGAPQSNHTLFMRGAFQVVLSDGIVLTIDVANQRGYLNAENVPVEICGEGHLKIAGSYSLTYPFRMNAGAVLNPHGEILFEKYKAASPSAIRILDDAVIGPRVTRLRTLTDAAADGITNLIQIASGVTATLCGDVDFTRRGDVLTGGRLVVDATAAARTFRAFVPEADAFVLEKRGANELVVGATPNLPNLVVTEGTVRITNDCVVGRLACAVGTRLVADGAVVTLRGASDFEGVALETANGGAFASAATVYSRHADAASLPRAVHMTDGAFVFSRLGVDRKFWRWTMTRRNAKPGTTGLSRIFAFGSDGTCVNYELADDSPATNVTTATIPVAEGKMRLVVDPSTNIVFSESESRYREPRRLTYTSLGENHYPHLSSPLVDGDEPRSALSYEFRLLAGKAPVTGYTLVAQPPAYFTDWTVSASEDGLNWSVVDTRAGVTHPGATSIYATYDNKGYTAMLRDKGSPSRADFECFTFAGYVTDGLTPSETAMSVQADGSATIDLSTFSPAQAVDAVTVDLAAGAGLVKGFAFAPTGEVRIVNAPASRYAGALPLTLKGVTGVENLRTWRVPVNGADRGLSVKYVAGTLPGEGRLFVYSKGMVVTYR